MMRGQDMFGIESIAESALVEMITDPAAVESVANFYKGSTLRFKQKTQKTL